MGAFYERDAKGVNEDLKYSSKPITIRCPKVTYPVSMFGKTEYRTYHDITDVFLDFEEGKVMGRILKLER